MLQQHKEGVQMAGRERGEEQGGESTEDFDHSFTANGSAHVHGQATSNGIYPLLGKCVIRVGLALGVFGRAKL